MGFFCDIEIDEIRKLTNIENEELDHTLTALKLSGQANAVSKMHFETLYKTWKIGHQICNITYITNAQNFNYWHDKELYKSYKEDNDENLKNIKKQHKLNLFEIIADQCGEIYNENIFTLVFAKRFAGYKRADIFFHDMKRFKNLVTNKKRPIQIIWAGKPYPMDYIGIGVFDKIVEVSKSYRNCSVLVGYELNLSKLLKKGSDAWLNMPRVGHEASGTSGMAAAMNGSINIGLPDGWFPEFAKDGINSFIINPCNTSLPDEQQDDLDSASLYDRLENEIIPMYYDNQTKWISMLKNAMGDIIPTYDSNRLAKEYYEKLYTTVG
jgi:starch phosphorylase